MTNNHINDKNILQVHVRGKLLRYELRDGSIFYETRQPFSSSWISFEQFPVVTTVNFLLIENLFALLRRSWAFWLQLLRLWFTNSQKPLAKLYENINSKLDSCTNIWNLFTFFQANFACLSFVFVYFFLEKSRVSLKALWVNRNAAFKDFPRN